MSPRWSGAPFLTVWRSDDYGADPENFCVVQHPRSGLIYVGNNDGVLEFDGARWQLLPAPGGAVIALGVDRRGRVWGATRETIFRLEPDARGHWQARSMNERLPAGFPGWAFQGRCVVADDGVYFFTQKSLVCFGLEDGPARTWAVAEGTVVALRLWEIGGIVHVMIGGNVVYRLRDGKLERVPGLNYTVCAASAEADGSWQLLTVAGTEHWDGHTLTLKGRLPVTEGTQRAAFLADGRGVFATQRNGLVVSDRAGQIQQAIGRAQGLPGNQVVDLIADRQGGVWAVYRNGVARVQLDSPYAWHGPAQGVEGTILSLVRRGDRLFLGGTEGAAVSEAGGRFHSLPEVTMAVREITSHDDWLFIHSTQLYGLPPAPDRGVEVLENRNYFGLVPLAGQPGWFAFGCNEGVRWGRFRGEQWITRGPLAAFSGTTRVLLESPASVIWAARDNGAWRIDFRAGLREDASAKPFGATEGLGAVPTTMFLLGGKIVALAAGQLLRFEETSQRFVPETRLLNLDALTGRGTAARAIDGAYRDSDGTIWLQGSLPNRGIARLVPESGEHWRVAPLTGEPLRHLQPTTLYHDPATRTLWIGGYGALVSRDLNWQPTQPSIAPAVSVRRIETAAGELLFGGHRDPGVNRGAMALRLAPDQDALRIQFAAPVFAPDQSGAFHTEYRTRLEGLDRDWSAWSPKAERDLTNLPWRTLTFHVQARDEAGRIGEEAVVAFSIAPAWWATRWAWAGYGVLGVLGVVGLVRLRTQALHRRASHLEHIVADRTHELAQSNAQLATQNSELARLHRLELDEKIAAQLAEEKARLELLRYQLNPHFLLNAFTTLRSLIFSSPEAAGKTVERLAEFCRLALTRSDESGASVDDEVRLIESYLATEQARWRDELQAELNIDPAARPLPLPPFLLQPLVENAIKYGGRTSPGVLHVRVTIARTDDGLAIEIANTGEWVAADSPHRTGSTGIGLENLHQRLRRQYREAHEFATEARDGWVFVRLHLGKIAGPPSSRSLSS